MSEPEAPTPEEAHAFLNDDNEKRIVELVERTQGQMNLAGAFEQMRNSVYLKHLMLEMGILDRADFDFEGQRSKALDKIEEEVVAHEEQMEKARRQAMLMGQRPGHVEGAGGPRIIR